MVGESGILRFKRLSDKAFIPTRGSEKAAGFDLKSAYNIKVPARGKALCMTDIQIALPSGCYGRIAPRSGLALKHGLDVGAGVVDEDYRGNVGVILFNHSDIDFEVKEGDRIAQLICERILYPDLVEVHDLDKTERDVGGFGSTGGTTGVVIFTTPVSAGVLLEQAEDSLHKEIHFIIIVHGYELVAHFTFNHLDIVCVSFWEGDFQVK